MSDTMANCQIFVSIKGGNSHASEILDQRRQKNQKVTNEYFAQAPGNIPIPTAPSIHAALSVRKESFVEPPIYTGVKNPGPYALEHVRQKAIAFSGSRKNSNTKSSEDSIKTNILSIDSTAGDLTSNFEEPEDTLLNENNLNLENQILIENSEREKLGNLDKDQFLAFLSPLTNSNPRPQVPERLTWNVFGTLIELELVKSLSEKSSLEKVVKLMGSTLALNRRFVWFLHPSPDEAGKGEEAVFQNFLFSKNKEKEEVNLKVYLNKSEMIRQKLARYLSTEPNTKKGLPARKANVAYIEVSQFKILAVELGLLFVRYYYENMNQEKWKYLFGEGSQYLGFWATLKLKTERGDRIKLPGKSPNYWNRALFPWVERWNKPPEGYPQNKIAPTLNEWQKHCRAKLSTLEGVEKHFLPPKDSWMYKRIRLGLKAIDEPSADLKKNMEGNIQDLTYFFAIMGNSNNDIQNERIGRYNNGSFFEKMKLLMLTVYKFNFSFLNHVGKGNPFLVVEGEQKRTQTWLKKLLINFLLWKPNVYSLLSHKIASLSWNSRNWELLADLLEKIIQEQSKFDEDSGSFGTEVDDMITQLALVILASYYEEVNGDKWKVLFSRSIGSLEFVEFMVVCLKKLDATKVTHPCRNAEMRGLFPWKDLKSFEAMPLSVRKFKTYTKKDFASIEAEFSNQQIEKR
ncbi:hypothetical protein O181_012730 [Austropuccinia psidii MF-1]|uniref:Uncharacterized protein n=1 Tax=Austropuccinia psidii MF-1 TaxID=1389203 RepID=A0A9Q3BXN0_9BASI|nr:hypothetical protein [Austropuccinia psidii MF-1]